MARTRASRPLHRDGVVEAQRGMRGLRTSVAVVVVAVVVVVVAVAVSHLLDVTGSHGGRRTRSTSATANRASVTRGASGPESTTSTRVPDDAIHAAWIARENLRPGTKDWIVHIVGKPADIEGYASVTSAEQGDPVTLYVTTKAPTWHVEAYRMGWYQGLGGRFVWTSPEEPGVVQPTPTRDPKTRMIEAPWKPSLTFTVGRDWPPGTYLLKLVASTGPQRWVPLTVRDDSSRSAYLVVDSVTTWQAYNTWGGCSLYQCPGEGGARAYEVSFDRPYALGTGSGDFLGNELPLVMRMEEWGLDVSYATSVDLDVDPTLMLHHRVQISLGHDEYWSQAMYDGVEAARDSGVNLMFLGANAMFRHIRLVPSPIGPARRQINYRIASLDPLDRTDPADTTVQWREAPNRRPEATVIGEQYECNPVHADGVVYDALPWVFDGTGLTEGAPIEGLIGPEYDRFLPAWGGPPNVQVLMHSPLRCRGHASWSDMTYYTASSGAGVFAVGTNWWISKLTPPGLPGPPFEPAVMQITRNVLDVFGRGPAGVAHSSVSNWRGMSGIPAPGTHTPTTTLPSEA